MRIIVLFHQFKDLLLGSSQFLLSKFSSGKAEVQEAENSLTDLPQNIASQLSLMVSEGTTIKQC